MCASGNRPSNGHDDRAPPRSTRLCQRRRSRDAVQWHAPYTSRTGGPSSSVPNATSAAAVYPSLPQRGDVVPRSAHPTRRRAFSRAVKINGSARRSGGKVPLAGCTESGSERAAFARKLRELGGMLGLVHPPSHVLKGHATAKLSTSMTSQRVLCDWHSDCRSSSFGA